MLNARRWTCSACAVIRGCSSGAGVGDDEKEQEQEQEQWGVLGCCWEIARPSLLPDRKTKKNQPNVDKPAFLISRHMHTETAWPQSE